MAIEHCPLCNKLFNRERQDLCTDCLEIENQNITKITNYLKNFDNLETENVSLKTLSEETNIDPKEIERLYRADKLRGCVNLFDLKCKLCGATFKPTIFTGYLCKSCSTKIEKIAGELKETGLEKLSQEEKIAQILNPKDPGNGMHLR